MELLVDVAVQKSETVVSRETYMYVVTSGTCVSSDGPDPKSIFFLLKFSNKISIAYFYKISKYIFFD